MADKNQVPQNLTKLVNDLDKIEHKLHDLLGGGIFDYVFLFDKEESFQINFKNLSPQATELIKQYIQTAEAILAFFDIQLQKKSSELTELFLEAMHDIYLVRYVEARREFAEFQLVRIPTKLERKLIEKVTLPEAEKPLPTTITFTIPDAFVVDDAGMINIDATRESEKIDHQIKSYLSVIPHIIPKAETLLNYFEDITIFGLAPLILKEDLLQINEVVIQTAMMYFAADVYSYIANGIPMLEAIANVDEFYRRKTNYPDIKFPPELELLGKELEDILLESFSRIPKLKPETVKSMVEEHLEIILFMINDGALIPENYYRIQFRTENQFDKYEQKFNYIIDIFLILDDGTELELPVESYNIEFTEEAKTQIFGTVTNGIENPGYKLVDYLREKG